MSSNPLSQNPHRRESTQYEGRSKTGRTDRLNVRKEGNLSWLQSGPCSVDYDEGPRLRYVHQAAVSKHRWGQVHPSKPPLPHRWTPAGVGQCAQQNPHPRTNTENTNSSETLSGKEPAIWPPMCDGEGEIGAIWCKSGCNAMGWWDISVSLPLWPLGQVSQDWRLTAVFFVILDRGCRWLSKRVSGGRKRGARRRLVCRLLLETGVFYVVSMDRLEGHRTTVLGLRLKVRTPHRATTPALTTKTQTAANHCQRHSPQFAQSLRDYRTY